MAGAFNKQINKSVYHVCKIIYRCFESSTSKSDHVRFSSQCELTNIWSMKNKKLLDLFVQFD